MNNKFKKISSYLSELKNKTKDLDLKSVKDNFNSSYLSELKNKTKDNFNSLYLSELKNKTKDLDLKKVKDNFNSSNLSKTIDIINKVSNTIKCIKIGGAVIVIMSVVGFGSYIYKNVKNNPQIIIISDNNKK
jgi:hypothetical protein